MVASILDDHAVASSKLQLVMHTISLDLLGRPAEAVLPVLRHVWGENLAGTDICVERLSGAMTNHVFHCKTTSSDLQNRGPSTVIVRVSGERNDQDASHNMEMLCSIAAAKLGIGPQLLLEFNNGRVEECLEDYRTMNAKDLRQPGMSRGIAKELALFHNGMGSAVSSLMQNTSNPSIHGKQTETHNSPQKCMEEVMFDVDLTSSHNSAYEQQNDIWSRMKQWATKVQANVTCYSSSKSDATLEDLVKRLIQDSPKLLAEVEWLKDLLDSHFPSWQVLGHNDLQYGNIMVAKSDSNQHVLHHHHHQQQRQHAADDSVLCSRCPHPLSASEVIDGRGQGGRCRHSRSIRLIDYDYSTWAPAFFDIANHWCEWGADYHSDKPHVMDFTRFPTSSEQLSFLAEYVNATTPQLGFGNSTQSYELQMDAAGTPKADDTCNANCTQPLLAAAAAAPTLHDCNAPEYVRLLHNLLHQKSKQQTLPMPSLPLQRFSKEQCVGHCTVADTTAQQCHQPPANHFQDAGDDGGLQSFMSWCQRYHMSRGQYTTTAADLKETSSQENESCIVDKHSNDNFNDQFVIDEQHVLAKLQCSCLAWTAASHIHWALWGVLHHATSTIDFDYLGYAAQRYHQYHLVKSVLLQYAIRVHE